MKTDRADYEGTRREAARRARQGAAPKPAKKSAPKSRASTTKGRREILPALWLQGFQGLISQALGFRFSRSHRGNYKNEYYQGQATETEHKRARLAKRRAKTKQGRRTRVHQSMARRGK